jgi:hypothetical protein
VVGIPDKAGKLRSVLARRPGTGVGLYVYRTGYEPSHRSAASWPSCDARRLWAQGVVCCVEFFCAYGGQAGCGSHIRGNNYSAGCL